MGHPTLHPTPRPSAQPAGPAAYLSSCCPPSPCRRNRRRARRLGREGWTSGRDRECKEPPPASGTRRRCSRARSGAGRWPPWQGLAKGDRRPFRVSMGAAGRSADPPALLPASAPHPGPPRSFPNSLLAVVWFWGGVFFPSSGFWEPAGVALPPRAPLCAAPAVVVDAAAAAAGVAATARATTKGREGEMEAEGGGEDGSGVHVMPMPPASSSSSPGTGTEGGSDSRSPRPLFPDRHHLPVRGGGGAFSSARGTLLSRAPVLGLFGKERGRTLGPLLLAREACRGVRGVSE